ncbi:protein of unknown function [Mesotoga infera]|uniref:Uncharacterized protein n=1 Tax=Mesotoga infera TaxID=1236046 RepID=A0A7Z7LES9_9BACT|nr:protein of unknown function [Mesotoga infera]
MTNTLPIDIVSKMDQQGDYFISSILIKLTKKLERCEIGLETSKDRLLRLRLIRVKNERRSLS